MRTELVESPRGEHRRYLHDDDAPAFEPTEELWKDIPSTVVAFWDFTPAEDSVKVHFLAVREDLRGQGMMRKILDLGLLKGRHLDAGIVVPAVAKAIKDIDAGYVELKL